jgi:hypothetical protein
MCGFLDNRSAAFLPLWKGNVAFHMRYMIRLALEFIPPSFGGTFGYWLYMKKYYTYNIYNFSYRLVYCRGPI